MKPATAASQTAESQVEAILNLGIRKFRETNNRHVRIHEFRAVMDEIGRAGSREPDQAKNAYVVLGAFLPFYAGEMQRQMGRDGLCRELGRVIALGERYGWNTRPYVRARDEFCSRPY